MNAYVGIGSNLGDRRAYLGRGLRGLDRAGLPVISLSSIWETEPVGGVSGPWFLNMAAEIRADAPPLVVLGRLLAIERSAGRHRTHANAPRTLDLDLLLAGDLEVHDPRLELPHPRMWERRFVLEPLAEIAPDLRNPKTGRTVEQERRRLLDGMIVRKVGVLASP